VQILRVIFARVQWQRGRHMLDVSASHFDPVSDIAKPLGSLS